MESFSENDLLNFFQKMNIDSSNLKSESYSWLFERPQLCEIFHWLCEYADDTNANTASETLLTEKHPYKEAGEFERAMSEVNGAYPGIFDVDANEVHSLRRKVENAREDESYCNKLMNQHLALDNKIGSEINMLTEVQLNAQMTRQALINECILKSKRLDVLHGDLYNIFERYRNIFQDVNAPCVEKYFLSQFPLSDFKQYSHTFNANIHLLIQKKLLNTVTEVNIDDVYNELQRLKDNLQTLTSKYIEEECVKKELEIKLESPTITSMNYSAQRARDDEFEIMRRMLVLNEENKLLTQQLNEEIERYVNRLINDVLYEKAVLKLKKCSEMLNFYKGLHTAVVHALGQYQLLCLLIHTDKYKMAGFKKTFQDISAYVTKYHKQYLLRYKVASRAKKEAGMACDKGNKLMSHIVSIITGDQGRSVVSVKDAIRLLKHHRNSIEKLESVLFCQKNKEYNNAISSELTKVKGIKNFIYSGPTLYPDIIPFQFVEYQVNNELWRSSVNRSIQICLDSYRTQQNQLRENRWLKYRCFLWAWFLTNPEQLVTIISELEDYVKRSVENV